MSTSSLPRFFRLRQTFPRPQVPNIESCVAQQLSAMGITSDAVAGKTVAITVGSRGIANIARVVAACVAFLKQLGAQPFIVPAMGSHGGATAEGQVEVLAGLGVSESSVGAPIRSSMEVIEVCQAPEGFPVYFDQQAAQADHVLVVNRVKPHTRFDGDIESGLMKMMLIGLGKKRGAEVYHRTIINYSFDQIVRSVAKVVIDRCQILGGLAILENAFEETAELVGLPASEIEAREPDLLRRVKSWMPRLPFDTTSLLIVDRIGKNISGTGMDTNVIGRKKNDHAAIGGDSPDIHTIYVRGLTEQTHGNASGIGLAELCHQRVLDAMDPASTRMNCITAAHVTGAMIPLSFGSDVEALQVGCQLAGYVAPSEVSAMWIRDTLSLQEIECSEVFFSAAQEDSSLEVLTEPRELQFNEDGDLVERFID